MNIRALIIDDEPLARDVLVKYTEDYPGIEVVEVCKDAISAMQVLENEKIDLLLLDINMPKLSGINFYKSIGQKPKVIFTTAYPEHAVEGFEVSATDYLVKPFSFERFAQAINKVKQSLTKTDTSNAFITLKADNRYHRILTSEISHLEALGDFVKVHTSDKVLIISDTLKNLTSKLPESFVQIHKSYVISLDHLEFVQGNQAKVRDSMIPIGQSFRKKIKEIL